MMMNYWLVPMLLFLAYLLLIGTATWAVVRHTGCTSIPRFPWSQAGPLGAGCAAAVAGPVFHLSVPWIIFAVGVTVGTLQFVVQTVHCLRAN